MPRIKANIGFGYAYRCKTGVLSLKQGQTADLADDEFECFEKAMSTFKSHYDVLSDKSVVRKVSEIDIDDIDDDIDIVNVDETPTAVVDAPKKRGRPKKAAD